jgi:hypothetical protein
MPRPLYAQIGAISTASPGFLDIQHFNGASTRYTYVSLTPSFNTAEVSSMPGGAVRHQRVTNMQTLIEAVLDFDGTNVPPVGSTFMLSVNGDSLNFVIMAPPVVPLETDPGTKITITLTGYENVYNEPVTVGALA